MTLSSSNADKIGLNEPNHLKFKKKNVKLFSVATQKKTNDCESTSWPAMCDY